MLDAHFALQDKKLLGDLSQLEVFVNGAFCRAEDAKISVWDHGLLYGDGIFEGIRAYQGGVFKLNVHLERLFESAKAIGMTCLLYTSPSPRDRSLSRMPSSA